MKATIIIPFRDKDNFNKIYNPGDVEEFDNDRAAALAARGLVKPITEEVPVINEATEVPKTKGKKSKSKQPGDSAKPDELAEE